MSMLTNRLREAQVAVMLLTRLPVGSIAGKAPDLGAARWAFPWVGLPVGLLIWAAHAGATALGATPLVAAFLAFGALAAVTGALHLDGLADTADGLGGGRDIAHRLEIMRDSRIGSYGVVALILMAGLWSASLSALAENATLGLFLAVAVTSRAAMVLIQTTTPTARDDGLGVLAGGSRRGALPSLTIVAVFALLTLGIPGIAILATGGVIAIGLARTARRTIGGHTGDILGAAQVTSETAMLVVLSLILAG